MKTTMKILVVVMVWCLTLTGWAKPSAYDLVGPWNGTIEFGKFKFRIRLKIMKESDGRLAAKMDMIDQGARDLPIGALLYNDPAIRLEFDQFNTSFNGTVSSDRNEIKGTLEEGPGGKPVALNFKRASESAEPETVKTYTFKPGEPRDLRGYWKTTLQPVPGMTLRLGLKIGRKTDGNFEALLDSLDQGAKDIPATLVTVTNGNAKLEWQGIQLVYEAALKNEGNQLTGSWKQGPKPLDVTFERIDKPATVLPENLSYEPSANLAEDFRGRWQGVLQIPERELRLAIKIGRTPDGVYAGSLAMMEQGGMDMPLSEITVTNATVRVEMKMMRAVYSGSLTNAGKTIDGKWEQMGNSMPLKLERSSSRDGVDKPSLR